MKPARRSKSSLLAACLALLALSVGCTKDPPGATSTTTSKSKIEIKKEVYPAPKRLVAFGDVHGDLDATKRALKLVGAIDDSGAWIGADLFVVQVGDQLDRGDDDRAILDMFDKLREEAKAAGGTFLPLNGNHELMNVSLNFNYVTKPSLDAFADIAAPPGVKLSKLPAEARGRAAAFAPGGVYAQKLATRSFYAIVGDTVFVHGGILPKHVRYGLEKIDDEMQSWLLGKTRDAPPMLVAEDGAVWLRIYSAQTGPKECKILQETLDLLGVKRMVVGHTVQNPDISFACDNKIVRTDIGMSRGYHGASIQAIEIVGDTLTVLKEK